MKKLLVLTLTLCALSGMQAATTSTFAAEGLNIPFQAAEDSLEKSSGDWTVTVDGLMSGTTHAHGTLTLKLIGAIKQPFAHIPAFVFEDTADTSKHYVLNWELISPVNGGQFGMFSRLFPILTPLTGSGTPAASTSSVDELINTMKKAGMIKAA